MRYFNVSSSIHARNNPQKEVIGWWGSCPQRESSRGIGETIVKTILTGLLAVIGGLLGLLIGAIVCVVFNLSLGNDVFWFALLGAIGVSIANRIDPI